MTLFDFNKILIGLLLLLLVNSCFSQIITRRYIDSLLTISDTTFRKNLVNFYVVNGIPYDSMQVETEISKYDVKYLADAFFISREGQAAPFYRDLVVIVFAYNQKNKIKRKKWKTAKKLLTGTEDTYTSLLINKVQINPLNSKETFNGLQLRGIMYIDIIQKGNIKQVKIWKHDTPM